MLPSRRPSGLGKVTRFFTFSNSRPQGRLHWAPEDLRRNFNRWKNRFKDQMFPLHFQSSRSRFCKFRANNSAHVSHLLLLESLILTIFSWLTSLFVAEPRALLRFLSHSHDFHIFASRSSKGTHSALLSHAGTHQKNLSVNPLRTDVSSREGTRAEHGGVDSVPSAEPSSLKSSSKVVGTQKINASDMSERGCFALSTSVFMAQWRLVSLKCLIKSIRVDLSSH